MITSVSYPINFRFLYASLHQDFWCIFFQCMMKLKLSQFMLCQCLLNTCLDHLNIEWLDISSNNACTTEIYPPFSSTMKRNCVISTKRCHMCSHYESFALEQIVQCLKSLLNQQNSLIYDFFHLSASRVCQLRHEHL